MSIEDRERHKRKLKYINAGKNIFLIIVIGSAFMSQILWFSLAGDFSLSYDIETYDEKYPNAKSFGNLMNSFFEFMRDHPINFSQAANNVIKTNTSFIEQIEEEIQQNITNAQQIYDAYMNNNISESSIITFLDQTWNNVKSVMPADFLNPAKVILKNGGFAPIESISFKGKVSINNRSATFLKNINNKLSQDEQLVLQITLKQVLVAIINIGMNLLVEVTLQVLDTSPHEVYNTTIQYFRNFANNFGLNLEFNVYGVFGLLPISLDYSIDLITIFKHLNI